VLRAEAARRGWPVLTATPADAPADAPATRPTGATASAPADAPTGAVRPGGGERVTVARTAP
jgi:hypothetical protein